MLKLLDGTNEEDILPALLPVFKDLQIKHFAKSADTLLVKYMPHSRNTEAGRLLFFDPKFVGGDSPVLFELRYAPSYTRGKDYEFVIWSKRIHNAKFSAYNSDYNTRATVDPKKAVRIALEVAKPFSLYEVGLRTKQEANRQHEMWMTEGSHVTMAMNLGHREMYEELCNLVKQGVSFVTPAFKKAVEAMGNYEQWLTKQKKAPLLRCLIEEGDKFFSVVDAKTPPVAYANFELLPEQYQSKVSLLRIMGNKHFIPEVGYKADDNVYWLYD